MNPPDLPLEVEIPAPKPEFPTAFVVATFVGAAIVGAAILYFGLTGQFGGPIP